MSDAATMRREDMAPHPGEILNFGAREQEEERYDLRDGDEIEEDRRRGLIGIFLL